MRSPAVTLILSVASALLPVVAKSQPQSLTDPPPSQHPVLTLHATGSQIYSCQRVANSYQWVFLAPAARLFDDSGNEVANHGDGPTWNYQDSSSVQGVVEAKSPSPDPTAIPWLLLKAVHPQRTGILTTVDFIRRSDTHGGLAPAMGCGDSDHQGALARVPYTAVYTFYSAKPRTIPAASLNGPARPTENPRETHGIVQPCSSPSQTTA